MNRAMTRLFLDNKSDEFLKACTLAWRQTPEEKYLEGKTLPSTLSTRLTNPLEFSLDSVLAVIRDNVDTDIFAHCGILLELGLGCRSVDLLNPSVMHLAISSNPLMVTMTGHSKIRSDALWEEVKQQTREVQPVGLTPQEALDMLTRYRVGLPEIIASFEPPSSLTPLQRLQFINNRLSLRFAGRLASAARQLFPDQAARGGKFGSHTFRALHANMSYALHGAGQSEDVFFKQRLQHADFGSVCNYKTVRLQPTGFMKELAAICSRLDRLEGKVVMEEVVAEVTKKRKKPVLPQHRPVGDQYVTLRDNQKKEHTILKYKVRHGTSAEDRLDLVRDAESKLQSLAIPCTVRNIAALGIGSRCVNLLRTNRKKQRTSYSCTDYKREFIESQH
jgi:hypothetical protein